MDESPHHGDRWFKDAARQGEARERIAALVDDLVPVTHQRGRSLGTTGEYPHGALTPDDKGEIRFAITAESGRVVLAFGTTVQWIGFTPQGAVDLADALVRWAKSARLQQEV